MSSANYTNPATGEGPTKEQIKEISNYQTSVASPDIKAIETRMQELYAQLTAISANDNSSSTDKNAQIANIQRQLEILSKSHETIVLGMQGQLKLLNTQVGMSREELVDQATVAGVIEQELQNAEANMDAIKDAKNNKLRLTEINTYYSKRYEAHIGLMKTIILISVILLLLAIFRKKAYIGSDLAKWLSLAVLIIGGLVLIGQIVDMSRRDNMNYDEYNFYSLKNTNTSSDDTVWEYDKKQLTGWKDKTVDSVDNLISTSEDMIPDISLYESSTNEISSESFKNRNNVRPYVNKTYTNY